MLRQLHQKDIPQLQIIEDSVHLSPWTRETFIACFKANFLALGIELEGQIIGFIIASSQIDECHILNLCVKHSHQHQGWGRKLLTQALLSAKQKGAGIAYLEVRESNQKAIALYKKMNFQLIGKRKDYYPSVIGTENALVYAKDLRLLT